MIKTYPFLSYCELGIDMLMYGYMKYGLFPVVSHCIDDCSIVSFIPKCRLHISNSVDVKCL